MVESLTG